MRRRKIEDIFKKKKKKKTPVFFQFFAHFCFKILPFVSAQKDVSERERTKKEWCDDREHTLLSMYSFSLSFAYCRRACVLFL